VNCRHCERTIRLDDAVYCPYCGKELRQAVSAAEVRMEEIEPPRAAKLRQQLKEVQDNEFTSMLISIFFMIVSGLIILLNFVVVNKLWFLIIGILTSIIFLVFLVATLSWRSQRQRLERELRRRR
jgi:VIT1/CCC1 family predicted Fe2+/Mn2+ transporter